eukprot:290082-Prorocentrum_minimum.AAC.1
MSAQKIERQTLGKSLESTLIGMPIESSASVIVSSSRDVRGAGRPHTVASQRQPIRVRIRELQVLSGILKGRRLRTCTACRRSRCAAPHRAR